MPVPTNIPTDAIALDERKQFDAWTAAQPPVGQQIERDLFHAWVRSQPPLAVPQPAADSGLPEGRSAAPTPPDTSGASPDQAPTGHDAAFLDWANRQPPLGQSVDRLNVPASGANQPDAGSSGLGTPISLGDGQNAQNRSVAPLGADVSGASPDQTPNQDLGGVTEPTPGPLTMPRPEGTITPPDVVGNAADTVSRVASQVNQAGQAYNQGPIAAVIRGPLGAPGGVVGAAGLAGQAGLDYVKYRNSPAGMRERGYSDQYINGGPMLSQDQAAWQRETDDIVMGVAGGGDLPISREIGTQVGRVAGEAAAPIAEGIGAKVGQLLGRPANASLIDETGNGVRLEVGGRTVVTGDIDTRPYLGPATQDPQWQPGSYWRVNDVAAREGEQGKGYGNEFYRQVIQRAADAGVDGLFSGAHSPEAERVYQSMQNWPGVQVTRLTGTAWPGVRPDLAPPTVVRITDPAMWRGGGPPATPPSGGTLGGGGGAVQRFFHGTDPGTATLLATGTADKAGLNVALSPDLALGQGGKGAIVELASSNIAATPLRIKPGSAFVEAASGQAPEWQITHAPHNGPDVVASVTFQPGATIPRWVPGALRSNGWQITREADGTVRAVNPQLASPGTTMGSPPAIGGAVLGGVLGASQGDTPQERARNAALGAASGAVGGHLLASGSRAAGLSIARVEGEAAQAGAAAGDATRAGNILLSKLPEGVRDVVQEAQAAAPQVMEDARRGVLSDQAVSDLADQVGAKVGQVVKRWQPGQAQNAETLLALRQTLASKAQDVIGAQQTIQQGDNSAGSLLRLQLALKEHQAVQEAVSGTTAEAGRALRQFRQSVSGALASGNTSQMEQILRRMGGRDWTEDLAARLGQIDTTDPTQVATFIRSAAQPKLRDYVTELFYNSILSGPQTHIANSVSNTLSALAGPVERGVAAAVDVPVAALQGRPRERFFGEAQAGAFGLLQGLQDGVRGASYVLKNGFSLDDAIKGELRTQAFRGKLGDVINMPSRALNAEDAFFRGVLYRSNLNAEAYRMAAREGLSGGALSGRIAELLTTPPADLMERAGKLSEYQLFRQAPGKAVQALTQLRNSVEVGVGGKTVQPLRFVIPFLQTPVNVTKYGLERSPLGWLNVVGKQGANVSDSAARAMMGSAIAASLGAAVATGKLDITGAVPTSGPERDAFYRQGKLPFALRIGDTWYQYQRWEPFNQPLSMVAATIDAVRNAKAGVSPTQIGGQAALSIGQNLVSQNWFSGLNNLMNAIQDPARYGSQLAEQMAGSAVPFSGLSRSVANAVDPRQRNPQGVVQAVESTIPGVSQNVPARLNAFGQPEMQAGSPFIPYKSQTASTSPLEAELARLRVEPGLPGKSVRGIDLTPPEQQSHQVVAGHFIQQQLAQTMNNPAYQALDDTAKAHALETAITEGRNIGAERFIAALIRRDGAAAVRQRIAQKRGVAVPSGTTR